MPDRERRMGTLAVDFDKVIHAYSRGWQDGSIYDDPMPGAIDGLKRLLERYSVFVHTTREPAGVAEWLQRHGVPTTLDHDGGVFWDRRDVVLVTNRKLAAIAYIDDRAVQFRDWPSVLARFVELDRRLALPWADPFPWLPGRGGRCRARTDGGKRCELARHDSAVDHALERGMDTPRWTTRWTA